MNVPAWLKPLASNTVAAPILIVMILAMMILPLPPIALDVFFTFNIALSVLILLIGLQTAKPLEFLAFPTILLITTMLRLSLNVASTRVVLTEGHNGADAAGKVIESFGHFLIGGNFAIGIVVFIILTIINFMVVTKGAGRIAEVGARFTLDAMPGKQMAIDADLNAGLIGEDEARRRRKEVGQESEFYGAMDGASKYVRGDAVAGILITLINVVGGLFVGVMQHDMSFGEAGEVYTLLAIGDGLVAQIPSLIISVAAGIVVSRVANDQDIGNQLVSQLTAKPIALYITAGILGSMGMIPGMPNMVFLTLAGGLAYIGYRIDKKQKAGPAEESAAQKEDEDDAESDASWKDVTQVDMLALEVGYRLIPLVDAGKGGDLLKRIKGLRKKFAQEVGFLTPAIHIRDNLELNPNSYRILLKGVEVAGGEAMFDRYLAINSGPVIETLPGNEIPDPAFGLPSVWIAEDMKDHAADLGYTVVDTGSVIATHLNHVITLHADELLGRAEVQQLLDHVAKESPKLTEDLVPKLMSLSTVQKVLQNLLSERVHIRDMRSIVEALTDHGQDVKDVNALTSAVRISLSRAIVQQLFPVGNDLDVISIEPGLEAILTNAVTSGNNGTSIEPGLAETLSRQASDAVNYQLKMGLTPVLLVPAHLRVALSKFLRRMMPELRVLSHDEIPNSKNIRVNNMIGASL